MDSLADGGALSATQPTSRRPRLLADSQVLSAAIQLMFRGTDFFQPFSPNLSLKGSVTCEKALNDE